MNNGKRILVVDDEEILRKGLCSLFARVGYHTLEAGCGSEAYAILQQEEVDIVVSDVRMPDGDGIDLIRAIKARDPSLPVIVFMSGHSDLTLEEVYALGATAILSKPFERKRVVEVVEKALGVRFEDMETEDPHANEIRIETEINENAVGRGGFQLKVPEEYFLGTEVDFRVKIKFSGQDLAMEGKGVVRWISPAPGEGFLAGVEIRYLLPECKLLFGAWLNVKKPVAYIPRAVA